jgi:AraC family transcriptional regulator of arabinose operon
MAAKIQEIFEYLRVNLHRELSLAEMARAVGLSPSRLSSLVKAATGLSPGQYLKHIRMTRARELLEGTTMSVKEVMLHVGIQDKSHFTRDFKKHYGLTPSQCREQQAVTNRAETDLNNEK